VGGRYHGSVKSAQVGALVGNTGTGSAGDEDAGSGSGSGSGTGTGSVGGDT
jgi:hypothetical protein